MVIPIYIHTYKPLLLFNGLWLASTSIKYLIGFPLGKCRNESPCWTLTSWSPCHLPTGGEWLCPFGKLTDMHLFYPSGKKRIIDHTLKEHIKCLPLTARWSCATLNLPVVAVTEFPKGLPTQKWHQRPMGIMWEFPWISFNCSDHI